MPKRTRFFKTCVGVFQGGGCRGAAFVGAYGEAVARGATFAEVAGTSAGSIVAALIGAGATPEQLHEVITGLNFASLLKPSRPTGNRPFLAAIASGIPKIRQALDLYFDWGLHSSDEIERWVEKQLRKLLPNASEPSVTFDDLVIPTSIVSTDTLAQKVVIWSQRTNKTESVARAVRASCSIPLFFQPLDDRYIDGGVLSNLPSFVFSDREHSDRLLATRILAFALSATKESAVTTTSLGFLARIADTVVDGSQDLHWLRNMTFML
jgi:predicted acylesterase/phospholipase RssA